MIGKVLLIFKTLKSGLDLATIIIKKLENTPQEDRRGHLAELDKSIQKAKEDDDLRGLSEWLGKRL